MKKIYTIIIAGILFLGSCTNLENEVYDKIPSDVFPENETQIALIPVPVYTPLPELLDWGGWWFAQEITSDEVTCPTRLTDWDDGGKWRVLHQHTWTNSTEAINSMWSRFYRGIGEANRLIEYMSIFDQNENVLATTAKLKIMRAFYYYLTIDNYGDVPFITSFADAPEQPFKTSRAEIFDAITADIEENVAYLPASQVKTAVSKGMAFSLLAKLYLNAEVYTGTPQWEKAEAYCDSVIALGYYSLESDPLGPFITENENSPENIFTIPYDEDLNQGFNLHMRTLHYISNLTFNMSVGPWNGFCAIEDFYNSYEESDLRKEGFLVGQQYSYTGEELFDETAGSNLIFDPHVPALLMDGSYTSEEIRMSGARVVKFEIKLGAKDNLSNDFPIFRYADILLMKAECMIRLGGNGDEYVNMIRSRAGLSNWTGTDLDMLLAERGREMFWEAHRRQDLIRFGKFNDAWWEKDVSTPDRNTFPIPQWVIDANPNLAD